MSGEVVTRLRRVQDGTDTYGDPVWSDTPAETSLPGAWFAPGGTQEPVEVGRAAVISVPTVYFPHSWPDIQPTDQLRVRGVVYEVTGDPADWRSPVESRVGGLVVQLRRVEG
jgi:hypothetical protein